MLVHCLHTLLPIHQSLVMHRIAVESSVEHHVSLLRAYCVVSVLRDHLHSIFVVTLRAVDAVLRSLVRDVLTGVRGLVQVVVTWELTYLVT